MRFLAMALLITCGTRLVTAIEPIARQVPPVGIEIPAPVAERTELRLAELSRELATLQSHAAAADVDVLLKAVRLAVRQREIHNAADLSLLGETLDLASKRLEMLRENRVPWQDDSLTVRGFYSRIDGAPQPYGVVLPRDWPPSRPVPLYVWLHGRGDKTTDLHFIWQRLKKPGQIVPSGAIVIHPFGRQCLGYKSAGETDVFEAIDHVQRNYPIDASRIVLMGFSMGGAGAWHLGAHYTDQFVAVAPGAGFAETAEYNRMTPEQIAATPWYERRLWGVYDVPAYTRNLFNVPVVAYSGENDRQIQAARVMEAAYHAHGRRLPHEIGPGMGHKYHPDSLKRILSQMQHALSTSQSVPRVVRIQTRTLRYAKMHWLAIDRLHQHWHDTQVTAEVLNDYLRISTVAGDPKERNSNVVQLTIDPLPSGVRQVVIDGAKVPVPASASRMGLTRDDEPRAAPPGDKAGWRPTTSRSQGLGKRPGLQGPIDDAFLDRFLVVTPTGSSTNPKLDEWVTFELEHLRARWSALFRGDLPERPDRDVTEEDWRNSHLVLFGTPQSNALLARLLPRLPVTWDARAVTLGGREYPGKHVPLLIYPNPLNREKYVVINSGPTFRESHDRTNSLQNPKLPDWAIMDIASPPDGEHAGSVVDAGFFNEQWQFSSTESETR